jgi:hypothetical protein
MYGTGTGGIGAIILPIWIFNIAMNNFIQICFQKLFNFLTWTNAHYRRCFRNFFKKRQQRVALCAVQIAAN